MCERSRMDKHGIIARLRENETALRARGVTHAALFGSRARGDDRPGSDIDIMIEIALEAVQDVYAYVGLKSYIAELFAEPVDVVDRAALKPYVRPPPLNPMRSMRSEATGAQRRSPISGITSISRASSWKVSTMRRFATTTSSSTP